MSSSSLDTVVVLLIGLQRISRHLSDLLVALNADVESFRCLLAQLTTTISNPSSLSNVNDENDEDFYEHLCDALLEPSQSARATALLNSSTVQLFALLLIWYSVSSLTNIVGKRLLTIFPHPFTVTLAQLFHGWAYSVPLLRLFGVPQPTYLHSTRIYYMTIMVPLAIGKLLSQLTSQISLKLVPVSYTHTIKALMPMFTVTLSRLLLGQHQSITVYLSLVPIIVGVVVASVSELSFDMMGLASALFSTGLLAIQNIYSKQTLKHIDIHHLALLSILAKLAWCLLVPFWFLIDGPHINMKQEVTTKVVFFVLLDGLLNFLYNVLAFTMISRLSPLSYAIAGSTKRLVVIAVSIAVLHNPVTKMNLFGIGLALFGVVLYNKVKFEEKKQRLSTAMPSPML